MPWARLLDFDIVGYPVRLGIGLNARLGITCRLMMGLTAVRAPHLVHTSVEFES